MITPPFNAEGRKTEIFDLTGVAAKIGKYYGGAPDMTGTL